MYNDYVMGLDGPEFDYWAEIFSSPKTSTPTLRLTQSLVQWVFPVQNSTCVH